MIIKTLTAALVATGVLVSLEYTSVAQTNSSATAQNQLVSQRNRHSLSALDRQFMIQAAQGGMAEIAMGRLALERAASSDIKEYAQRMIEEHSLVNSDLMSLAREEGVALPKSVSPQQKAVLTRLSRLSGRSFDQAYMIEAGVKSHAQQAALFLREAQQGQDRDVKGFAQTTLPAVQGHLEMARAMQSGRAVVHSH